MIQIPRIVSCQETAPLTDQTQTFSSKNRPFGVLFLPNKNEMSPTRLLREKSRSVKFKSPNDLGTEPVRLLGRDKDQVLFQ